MSANQIITDLSIDVHGNEFTVRGEFEWTATVELEKAPDQMQREVDRMGQQLKREVYHEILQEADRRIVRQWQLVNPSFQKRGGRPYTLVTPFGTVKMKRKRLYDPQRNFYCVPAQKTWDTPHHNWILPGLRESCVEEMRQHSARQTVQNVTQRADEDQPLLGASTVLKILHQEGAALKEEQRSRAIEVLREDPEVFCTGLATWPEDMPAPTAELREEDAESASMSTDESMCAEEAEDLSEPVLSERERQEIRQRGEIFFGWILASADCVFTHGCHNPSPPEDSSSEQPRRRQVDPDRVIVQPDEVKTKAQATESPRKENWTYTATVQVAEKTYYFAEESADALWRLVAAVLTTLGVLGGTKKLTVIGDGAIWIREWFEHLDLPDTEMILCWFHLAQRVYQRLSAAGFSKGRREAIEHEVLGYLWRGNLGAAVWFLWKIRDEEARNPQWITDLIRYLLRRRDYIPDYSARYDDGFWIASNRVEKWNDWAVSDRCKRRGMSWTAAGVLALANFEAADRNGELDHWTTHKTLPKLNPDDPAQKTQAA